MGPTPPVPSSHGTYWQERACAPDYRWCVEWVRIGGDGRMEVGCVWRGDLAERGSDDGNRKLYLIDEAGRRYDHTATSGAAAYGGRGRGVPASLAGSYFFPAPSGARRFAFHDDERGAVIGDITLDPARYSSIDISRALLGRILDADSITIRTAWNGLGPASGRSIQLSRRAGGFAGELVESTEPRRYAAAAPSRSLVLPGPEATLFLETLVESALVEGRYQPTITHTDDYPSLHIDITVKDQTFGFSSQSQGQDHVPWALSVNGRSWIVPSNHPARALRIVEAIVDGKAPPVPTPDSGDGSEPLRIAAQRGDVERVKQLLADGASPGRRTAYDGESALTAAARWGQAGSVQALLDGGADPTLPNAAGLTALQLAARGGHAEVVKLLASGSASGEKAGRALFEAALAGSSEMLRSLLDARAPLDAVTAEGLRPLDGAILHGHLEAAQMLITAGADVRGMPKGWPPLHLAAEVGHEDVVELLLRSGAAVDGTYPADGTTALFRARVPSVTAALLRAGARPNARRANGATPLIDRAQFAGGSHYYIAHPRREAPPSDVVASARVLIDAGADVAAHDAQNVTALQAAASNLLIEHNVSLAVLLLERGADPNRRDAKGRTPLWHATEFYVRFHRGPGVVRITPLIRALVKARARNLPDAERVTPLDLARRSGSAPLLELLEGLSRR